MLECCECAVVLFPPCLAGFCESSIPTCACFIQKTLCDLFPFFGLEIVREKKGGKGRQGEDAWSEKYEIIELCCSQQRIIIYSNASK